MNILEDFKDIFKKIRRSSNTNLKNFKEIVDDFQENYELIIG